MTTTKGIDSREYYVMNLEAFSSLEGMATLTIVASWNSSWASDSTREDENPVLHEMSSDFQSNDKGP